MFCHISCRVEYGDSFVDVKATLPCESPLIEGPVRGLLTQLYPKAITFTNLTIHNEEEPKRPA